MKRYAFADWTPIRLSARETLLAASPGELVESTDGQVIGTADVYWNASKSD